MSMSANELGKEKQVSRETIYTGRIVNVYSDDVVLPDGNDAKREVVTHPGGSCVVAITENDEVYLVKQYRYPIEEYLIEVPAGKRDNQEDPFITAQRELEEEVGLLADTWIDLGSCFSSPGIFTERLYLYAALDLKPGHQHLDEGEYLAVEKIPFEKAIAMVMDGRITDSKTQLALLKYQAYRSSSESSGR